MAQRDQVEVFVRQWLTARAPALLVLVLGSLVVADAVHIGAQLARPPFDQGGRPALSSAFRPAASRPDPAAIAAAHLFGRSDTERAGAGAAASLKLTGAIATGGIGTDSMAGGYAIIQDPGGVSHLYSIGSRVVDGSDLSEVFSDHVILTRDGLRETLMLPHPRQSEPIRNPNRVAAIDEEPAAGAAPEAPSMKPLPMPTPGAILHALNLRPVVENGTRVGLRISQTGYGTRAVEALGLQVGDIVTSLDGQPVGGAGGDLMRAIAAGQALSLVVQRQGQLVPISIDPDRAEASADLFRQQAPP